MFLLFNHLFTIWQGAHVGREYIVTEGISFFLGRLPPLSVEGVGRGGSALIPKLLIIDLVRYFGLRWWLQVRTGI